MAQRKNNAESPLRRSRLCGLKIRARNLFDDFATDDSANLFLCQSLSVFFVVHFSCISWESQSYFSVNDFSVLLLPVSSLRSSGLCRSFSASRFRCGSARRFASSRLCCSIFFLPTPLFSPVSPVDPRGPCFSLRTQKSRKSEIPRQIINHKS